MNYLFIKITKSLVDRNIIYPIKFLKISKKNTNPKLHFSLIFKLLNMFFI